MPYSYIYVYIHIYLNIFYSNSIVCTYILIKEKKTKLNSKIKNKFIDICINVRTYDVRSLLLLVIQWEVERIISKWMDYFKPSGILFCSISNDRCRCIFVAVEVVFNLNNQLKKS